MSFTFIFVGMEAALVYSMTSLTISDLRNALREKIGEFVERKECNAEGKTSACQKKPSFISAMFYKIFTKKYTYQM
jgi:hypothetical protein